MWLTFSFEFVVTNMISSFFHAFHFPRVFCKSSDCCKWHRQLKTKKKFKSSEVKPLSHIKNQKMIWHKDCKCRTRAHIKRGQQLKKSADGLCHRLVLIGLKSTQYTVCNDKILHDKQKWAFFFYFLMKFRRLLLVDFHVVWFCFNPYLWFFKQFRSWVICEKVDFFHFFFDNDERHQRAI